jgi:hypothetical protein
MRSEVAGGGGSPRGRGADSARANRAASCRAGAPPPPLALSRRIAGFRGPCRKGRPRIHRVGASRRVLGRRVGRLHPLHTESPALVRSGRGRRGCVDNFRPAGPALQCSVGAPDAPPSPGFFADSRTDPTRAGRARRGRRPGHPGPLRFESCNLPVPMPVRGIPTDARPLPPLQHGRHVRSARLDSAGFCLTRVLIALDNSMSRYGRGARGPPSQADPQPESPSCDYPACLRPSFAGPRPWPRPSRGRTAATSCPRTLPAYSRHARAIPIARITAPAPSAPMVRASCRDPFLLTSLEPPAIGAGVVPTPDRAAAGIGSTRRRGTGGQLPELDGPA